MKYYFFLMLVLLAGCGTDSSNDNESGDTDTGTEPQTEPETEPVIPLLAGERADWLRGTWGINWKPVDLDNGGSETLSIDEFLEQISELKTIDYLQLHLNDSYIKSPVHIGPNNLLESLWQGDLGDDGKPLNLLVPRAEANIDPFLNMLTATKAVGLKTMVYLNSSNMLERTDEPNPDTIPNITERWKEFCDIDAEAQAFLATEAHHYSDEFPNRHYMFCYAEFVLKDYAIRYGDLVDAWLFDSGDTMVTSGDNATNGQAQDQLIYEAFTNAVRAGNPNVAVSYNNGPERETEELNPFSEAVLYEDFMFGHPYNGGRVIGRHDNGLYDRNYAHIQKITETDGNIHAGGDWTWDDKVVGHFDPPMSTTSWNGGSTPALTDEEFLLWNLEATRGGGAMSWGAPLIKGSGELNQLTIQDWGMAQLSLMDEHLSINQIPDAPNWARAETPLEKASFGESYTHKLTNDSDFWSPNSDPITLSLVSSDSDLPTWLTIEEEINNTGNWILSGFPTETQATSYEFILRAEDSSGTSDRLVKLTVDEVESAYPFTGNINIIASTEQDYGTDNVVTMISDLITAPDSLATFRLAFDVTPTSGGKIVSSDTTDATVPQSWGIDDAVFRGSDGDSIESMDNVRVVNFNANGSDHTESDISDFSFEYAIVADAQSSGDRILIDVDGITNADEGDNVVSNPDTISLKILGYEQIESLKLGVGTDATNNKWSINSINVSYVIQSR